MCVCACVCVRVCVCVCARVCVCLRVCVPFSFGSAHGFCSASLVSWDLCIACCTQESCTCKVSAVEGEGQKQML